MGSFRSHTGASRRVLLVVVALVAIITVAASDQVGAAMEPQVMESSTPSPKASQALSAAINQVTSGIDAAWNRGDAVAFASYWTENGTVVSPQGVLTEGRAAIERDMTAQFVGPMKDTRHKLTITRIYPVTPDVAVVDGTADVTIGTETFSGPFTAIFAKEGDSWKVVHMRGYAFIS